MDLHRAATALDPALDERGHKFVSARMRELLREVVAPASKDLEGFVLAVRSIAEPVLERPSHARRPEDA